MTQQRGNRYKERTFRVVSNRRVASKTWRMVLDGDTSDFTMPGQFINIEIKGKYLRRPISVCDIVDSELTLLYDVVGDGTGRMTMMQPGEEVDLLTGLGRGFDISVSGETPLLIGGGIGCAPLLQLSKALIAAGKRPTVAMGFNRKEDVVLTEEFEALGIPVLISTADGSAGTKGFVTDAIAEHQPQFEYYYACGPLPMLRALCDKLPQSGEISFESRMACGFGICMCCALETRNGMKGICKDGPVFKKEDLIWK